MADKYPSLSPYVYCANNPIRIIDPDGRDIIDVDGMGRTTITKQEGNDILRSAKTGKTQELSGNGVFAAALSENRDADGNVTSTTLSGMSKDDAKATLNFMGENTKSEWGLMEKTDGSFTVGSAHNADGETLIFNMAMDADPGTVSRYDHSHSPLLPGASGDPSTSKTSAGNQYSDVDAWKDLLTRHPKITLGISFKGVSRPSVKKGDIPGWLLNQMNKNK